MIALYNTNIELLALVPDEWIGRTPTYGDYTRYIIPHPMSAALRWDQSHDKDSLMSARDEMHTFDVKRVTIGNRAYYVLIGGLEHLQKHPDVALYPAGRCSDASPALQSRMRSMCETIRDNQPDDAIADGGLTVWDGLYVSACEWLIYNPPSQ